MQKINLAKESREALLKAAVVLVNDACTHPRQYILGQFPAHTGGKERCLLCKKIRTQLGHGGPWRAWKEEK